ncbi:MAG: Hpt domain-containing protein [Gemmatimonadota bacterium]|nr:Hpt domain-containing protein [Gemmatimonadota bacterium]
MSTPNKLLDFFSLEASEYLARIAAAISGDNADVLSLKSGARGLRGTATMARSIPIANLAGRLESIAAKIADGHLALDPPLRRVIGSAVETLNGLVRAVREWAPEHDERARRALDDLDSYAPGESAAPEDVIVPISELFYSDAGPHVIEVASSPRTTFEQRLREKQTRPEPPAANRGAAGAGLRGAALRDALGSSLARMHSLERPGEPPPQQTVPIQSLLYRGQSAVTRSKELRARILAAATPPSRDVIAELCDLVELACAE